MGFNAEVEPVSDTQRRIEYLALFAGALCFLIGWWHTGKGLAYMQILSSPYGGFVFATFVLSVLLIAYWKAIEGARFALLWYLLFALVNFACNLNSFYPNYNGNDLLRQELADHNASLVGLRQDIDTRFVQPELEKLKRDIAADQEVLRQQILQQGFGSRADQALGKIETGLGLPYGEFTRPKRGQTETEWESIAQNYKAAVDGKLNGYLKVRQYNERRELIDAIDSEQKAFGDSIAALLQSSDRITAPPPIIGQIVRLYRDTCKKAMVLAEASNSRFSCNADYDSPNRGFGSFSHTRASIAATINDGSTLAILAIVFFIDFGCPLAIYFLVRRTRSSIKWRVGTRYRPTRL